MFGSLIDSVVDTASDFVSDPIGKTIDVVTQPIRDGLDVINGLTEGELRTEAAARLGADVVGGMAFNELIEWHNNL